MSTETERLNDKICDRCGRPAAIRIEKEWLCEECYQTHGSCCPEFGGDDLWEEKPRDEPEETRRD